MTTLVYQKVEGGEATNLPELRETIEHSLPNHARVFHKILASAGMMDWKVRFMPAKNISDKDIGSGAISRGIKLIVISQHTKKEMLVTLYHEILHFKKPELTEVEVEAQSYEWYEQIWEHRNEFYCPRCL